jgi:hypothetical protein
MFTQRRKAAKQIKELSLAPSRLCMRRLIFSRLLWVWGVFRKRSLAFAVSQTLLAGLHRTKMKPARRKVILSLTHLRH